MTRSTRCSFVLYVTLAGCPPPDETLLSASWPEPGTETTGPASSSGAPTTAGEPTTSGTTTGSTGAPGDTTTAAPGSTGGPIEAPVIVGVEFLPNPLAAAGTASVRVTTENAEGVMLVDVEGEIPLTPDGLPGSFAAPEVVTAFSSQDNGKVCWDVVAWREGVEVKMPDACLEVTLPDGGSEQFWEGAAAKGVGSIVALATLPNGHVVEFGTFYPQGEPRCYLRRRDQGGAWGPGDFDAAMIDGACSATDMVATPTGELYVLATRTYDVGKRWWLGKQTQWKAAPAQVAEGAAGQTGRALALAPADEQVAVCGTQPTYLDDIDDAAVWIFRPNQPGETGQFDYVKDGVLHKFRETPYDCAFAGDTLVLAGDAFGFHAEIQAFARRLFLLEFDVKADTSLFTVASAAIGAQSGAQALAVDSKGRYVTAGYTCGVPCTPKKADLRVFAPGGMQITHSPLAAELGTPLDLAYSPAEYVVLAAGTSEPSKFTVEAWVVGEGAPVWSYGHASASAEVATAVTIGMYGQVYAGGISAGGFPAIAYIAP